MGKKGGSAPKADPRMGEAAMLSAKTGQEYLKFMMGQAEITNEWAEEDRAYAMDKIRPVEEAYIAEAANWDTAERRDSAAAEAVGDVRQQAAISRAAEDRNMAARGIDPRSGRSKESSARLGVVEALGSAGAATTARKRVEAEGEQRTANVINMGKGMAVNPGTAMQIGNGAASAGFNGAMNGYGQQASILNQEYQGRLQAHQASQQGQGMLGQALGTVAGAWLMSSSKEVKEDKRKVRGVLDALKAMPVEKWKYKDGEGDGGEHIGAYAEDFQKATGIGDGKSIDVISALGVTMGAVQELADKVDAQGEDAPKKGKAA